MRKKLLAFLLTFVVSMLTVPVFANASESIQPIEIIIEDGMATWNAIYGTTGHTVTFRWEDNNVGLFSLEPEIDLAQALGRISADTTPELFEVRVMARAANMRVLGAGSAWFRLHEDGTIVNDVDIAIYEMRISIIGSVCFSTHLPILLDDNTIFIRGNDLRMMGLDFLHFPSLRGVAVSGDLNIELAEIVLIFDGNRFNSPHVMQLPVGKPPRNQNTSAYALFMAGDLWVPIQYIAETLGMDFNFISDEFVIEVTRN